MSRQRSFSFGRDEDITNQATRRPGAYQVSSGAAYVSEPYRDYTSSPVSSQAAQARQGQGQAPSPVYSYPQQQQRQQQMQPDLESQMGGYRTDRHAAAASAQPKKPLPAQPSPQAFSQQDTSYRPHEQMSQLGVAAAAAAPGLPVLSATPDPYSDRRGYSDSPFADNAGSSDAAGRYRQSVGNQAQPLGNIEPSDIDDEEDDTLGPNSGRRAAAKAAPAAGAVAAGGLFSRLGGARDTSGSYDAVPAPGADKEKRSDWLKQQTSGSKRLKWIVGGLIALVIVLAIIGGVVGAVLTNKNNSSGSNSNSSSDSDSGSGSGSGNNNGIPESGQLHKNSSPIKKLMNNPKLHKVFPALDYSPLDTQYPDCLKNPPLQNNITADIAVLSQLTPIVRLYGTDCNQTQLVLEAIKTLDLEKEMKIWGGIYLDSNTTTNNRQISQMYDVLEKYGADQFEGIIVGNEVLFSEYLTEQQLVSKVNGVRARIKKMGLGSMKVGSADLGSLWATVPLLVAAVDVVISNVHPFFAGVGAPEAAAWTYKYWQQNDVSVTSGTSKESIIGETGWPSKGGQRCTNPQNGAKIKCSSPTAGAIAGISEFNRFMEDWVCTSLQRGNDYFWFEAFDEPWKVIFNTKNEHWEANWGLLDVNRNLKDGLVIPSCGGKTASLKKR